MNNLAGIFLSVIAVALSFILFGLVSSPSTPLGMMEVTSELPLRSTLGFSATLLGVLLGVVYRELREVQATGEKRLKVRAFFRDIRRSINLWLGMVGAPVVFALLLKSSEGARLGGFLVMALEHGFCCSIILNASLGHASEGLGARRETT